MTNNLDNLIKFNKLAEFVNTTALDSENDNLFNGILTRINYKLENMLCAYSLQKYPEHANRIDYYGVYNAYMRLQKYLFNKYCMGDLSYDDYQEKTKKLFYRFQLKTNLEFRYMLGL